MAGNISIPKAFGTKKTIGIIGGGQLGRMMTQKAKKLGFDVIILDPTPYSPAGQIADKQIVGDFYDETKLKNLVQECDVTTYDIEHINTEALKTFYDNSYKIYPSPYLLEIIQDKLKQKQLFYDNGIPQAQFKKIHSLDSSEFGTFDFPVVQKTQKGGYDGRGVVVLKNIDDIGNAIKVESFIEEYIPFEKELAVMVARNTRGEIQCYPVVEMEFDSRANICDLVIAPARVSEKIQKSAKTVAVNCVEVLEGVGIFGIEMFLTKEGKILVNEVAPRPHNSGHYTIEACVTCQFEQHIRAITGLPLGSTLQLIPAVMVNILGEEGYEGKPVIEGIEEALKIPGLSFHYYGKKITKPFRKMGHVTILDNDVENAIAKANNVKNILKVKSEKIL
ncbi:MAG: 5-(carboxyamino)imidazole ribonucleotide synthase [Bacteroidetes bacterium]|nr:5-(carboxyamino)imidazole ribonucleotide synthase [Bacteroidota bacterium]MBU1423051.1 5-(carboxyamino)imidazole ribonucleotide synthase [Bacteroidota bacterium]